MEQSHIKEKPVILVHHLDCPKFNFLMNVYTKIDLDKLQKERLISLDRLSD